MSDGLAPTRRTASLMRGPLDARAQRGALVVVLGLLLVTLAARGASANSPSISQLTASDTWLPSAQPSISADGSAVAFTSRANLTGDNPGGAGQIFVMNLDGTGLRQLTSGLYGSYDPSISADGSVVAFESQANLTGGNPDRSPEIFVVSSDGTGLLQLTSDPTETPYVYRWSRWPSISADGTVIAFASQSDLLPGGNPDHSFEIFVINSDGTGLWQLTTVIGNVIGAPSISGDGLLVTFHSTRQVAGGAPGGPLQIFAMNVDGTGLTQLTNDINYSSANPSTSADGSAIAFDSRADLTGENPDLSYEIFIISSDGTGLAQLTVDGEAIAGSRYPVISADGSVIAFEPCMDYFGGGPVGEGGWEIFAVNSDGTGLTQLTSDLDYSSRGPSVSGDGSLVAFASHADLTGDNPDHSWEVFVAVTADTTPPAITAPPDVEVDESDPAGTPVDLGEPTVSDNCDPDPTVENDAPALFALGVTTVTWTATDAAGNSASAEQTVTVVPGSPDNQLANLRKFILYGIASGDIAPEMESSLLAKVDAAIAALARGDPPGVKVVLNDLKALVNQVEAQTDKKIDPATAAEIVERANLIIAALGA